MSHRMVSVRDGMFEADVWRAGEGEPLLYLHGAGGLHEGEYLDVLAEQFDVIAPSHPGFGASTGFEHIDDIIDLALYYHDFMDELGIESANVVGHSMGGMLAAEMAALCSHRVRRLVLANPVGFWRDDIGVLDFFTIPPDKLLQYTWHDPQSEALKIAFPAPETTEALVEAMFQRMQSFSAASKFLWPIPDRGLKRRIHRIQSPTLIIWGDSDGLVSPAYAEDFRNGIRDARVEIIEECGHMPMFEQRDAFLSLVTGFLAPAASPA
jgi:pimeloyl-ACP methyl ester carboxylesterase